MAKKKNRNKNRKKGGGGGGNQAQTSNKGAHAAPVVAPEDAVTQTTSGSLPEGVESSLPLFTKQQQVLVKLLCSPILNQGQLFASWSDPNTSDALKKQLVAQLTDLNSSYPGGLAGYITNARKLLEDSRQGVNPLEGWKPQVPTGQAFEIGTNDYNTVEAVGVMELGSVGFVLVAGGLGERLGYGDIKVRSCLLLVYSFVLHSVFSSGNACMCHSDWFADGDGYGNHVHSVLYRVYLGIAEKVCTQRKKAAALHHDVGRHQ